MGDEDDLARGYASVTNCAKATTSTGTNSAASVTTTDGPSASPTTTKKTAAATPTSLGNSLTVGMGLGVVFVHLVSLSVLV